MMPSLPTNSAYRRSVTPQSRVTISYYQWERVTLSDFLNTSDPATWAEYENILLSLVIPYRILPSAMNKPLPR